MGVDPHRWRIYKAIASKTIIVMIFFQLVMLRKSNQISHSSRQVDRSFPQCIGRDIMNIIGVYPLDTFSPTSLSCVDCGSTDVISTFYIHLRLDFGMLYRHIFVITTELGISNRVTEFSESSASKINKSRPEKNK